MLSFIFRRTLASSGSDAPPRRRPWRRRPRRRRLGRRPAHPRWTVAPLPRETGYHPTPRAEAGSILDRGGAACPRRDREIARAVGGRAAASHDDLRARTTVAPPPTRVGAPTCALRRLPAGRRSRGPWRRPLRRRRRVARIGRVLGWITGALGCGGCRLPGGGLRKRCSDPLRDVVRIPATTTWKVVAHWRSLHEQV